MRFNHGPARFRFSTSWGFIVSYIEMTLAEWTDSDHAAHLVPIYSEGS